MRGNVGGLGRRMRHRGSAWFVTAADVVCESSHNVALDPPKWLETMALG